MKKKISLVLTALFLSACGGTENVGGKLSQDELDYLRTRAIAQCEADTENDLQNFIKNSNNAFGTSDYYRNRTWKYEWKEGSNSATRTATITSWKQDPNYLYFIVTTEVEGSTSFQFLKITKPTNKAMLEKLRSLYCVAKAKSETSGRANFSSTSASYKVVLRTPDTTTHDKLTTDQFNFLSSLPAYFAFYKQNRTLEKVELETNDVSPNKTFAGVLTSSGDEAPAKNLYSEYPATTQYCIVSAADGYDLPYTLNCSPTNVEFDPAELCRVNNSLCAF